MNERLSSEPTKEPISSKKLMAAAVATIVGGAAFGFMLQGKHQDAANKEADARAWLANRGIPACADAPGDTPCVLAAIPSKLEVVISRPDGETVTAYCVTNPKDITTPGCYEGPPDATNDHYTEQNLITGPESV